MQERILPRHFISMEEDIVLVCRKSKISMQEGREGREGRGRHLISMEEPKTITIGDVKD